MAIARSVAIVAVVLAAGPPALTAADPKSDRPGPRVLAEHELLGAKSPALDIRWAGKDSVWIATSVEQVAEHRLAPGLPAVRQLFPSPVQFDPGMIYGRLGVSADTLVVAQPTKRIAWRSLARDTGSGVLIERHRLGHVEDLDLEGDRVAWIGWRSETSVGVIPEKGGVAWIAHLEGGLLSPNRLLADTAGESPGRHLETCALLKVGALRFQRDGSLLVAPGFLDEIVLLDSGGGTIRTWNSRWFGIDTAAACGGLSAESWKDLAGSVKKALDWVNSHQVIDEVLALPDGPALVVRRLEKGLPVWRLHRLGKQQIASFDLPIRARSPYERLSGDAQGDRLVFLVSDWSSFPRAATTPSRVFTTTSF